MKNTLFRIFYLIKQGELNFIIRGILKRCFSKNYAFGLKRDLNLEFPVPEAQLDIIIRQYKDKDAPYFSKDLQNDGLIEKQIPRCYVATTIEDQPCFRQWIISAQYDDKIKDFWKGLFPVLRQDEMLLEGGFTVSHMRKKGIMPAAITKILDIENLPGRRWVITFVGVDNVPSLKGIHRSGFLPYLLRIEKWFLFRRTIIFKDIPTEFMNTYHKNIGLAIK